MTGDHQSSSCFDDDEDAHFEGGDEAGNNAGGENVVAWLFLLAFIDILSIYSITYVLPPRYFKAIGICDKRQQKLSA